MLILRLLLKHTAHANVKEVGAAIDCCEPEDPLRGQRKAIDAGVKDPALTAASTHHLTLPAMSQPIVTAASPEPSGFCGV